MRFLLSILACTLMLATHVNAQAGAKMNPVKVDKSFHIDNLTWNDSTTIQIALRISVVDGRYAVCSAAVFNNNKGKTLNVRALRSIKITVNRRTALRGLQFAKAYPRSTNLRGKQANCRLTKIKQRKGDKIGIEQTPHNF